MSTTEIEWTEHTWNPFVGCSVKSDGCKNCYAMKMAARVAACGTAKHYEGIVQKVNNKLVWTGDIHRASDKGFNKPHTIRKPSMIFVNSMSDFFHENAPDVWRVDALDIMKKCRQHQYQVLTKRPENIKGFLDCYQVTLPKNLWLGATVENEKVQHRIDTLRDIPAKIRFLSVEPLIGSVGRLNLQGIHWVIVGGESGPGARTCDLKWVTEVRDQCINQNVAFFFKQWGKPQNNPLFHAAPKSKSAWIKEHDPIGKGGSLLEQKYWKQWPQCCKCLRSDAPAQTTQEDVQKSWAWRQEQK